MRLIYITQAILLFFTISSCKKFTQVDSPPTQAELSKIFADDKSAIAAATGLYYQMAYANLTFCNGAITVYTGLSGDELVAVNPGSDYGAFYRNSIPADNSAINSRFWSNAYKNIYQANAVLEGLEQSSLVSLSVKKQLKGEMLFARALHYFYLVNIFGDVPLQTTTDYRTNSITPRTPAHDIYQKIIEDLKEAQILLDEYQANTANTRPDKMAVTALLARVYLFQNNWANAETEATKVISSGLYQLEPDLENVFINTSKESIFQLSRATANTAEGNTFIPSSSRAKPALAISSSLFTAFESNDLRRQKWLNKSIAGTDTFYYPFKYKVRFNANVSEYNVVLRLAEMYLIRAESKAQQDHLEEAMEDLNLLRNRAGLNTITTSSKNDLLTAVEHERRVEFFAEWGHRWLDIKRTGRADEIFSAEKGANWQPTDVLYPIPFTQIQRNPSLTQNQGY